MYKKILSILKHPSIIVLYADRKIFHALQDKTYIKLMYNCNFNKKLNLDKPETFDEKLQWLKLYDRKDIYTTMVDKYEAKEYVASIIGKKHIIPTIGIYNNFNEIDFSQLPDQFVIKCTHDSGGLVICKNKKCFSEKNAKKTINHCLRTNYYWTGREWPYKNVKPRIIIEKYLTDESKTELKDYKIFCFNGEPKLIMVDTNRFIDHKRNVYDTDWNLLDLNINFPSATKLKITKPDCLKEMLTLSRKLSKNIPFLRTDFYVVNQKIYFGELTFFPGSGFQKFEPEEWNKKLGKMINLNQIENNEK